MKRILTIGVSTRALFDMEKEHRIFLAQGAKAYVDYEKEHEKEVLRPGPAFALVEALLRLNERTDRCREEGEGQRQSEGMDQHSDERRDHRQTEVVIMSKNSAEAALRIFHSIEAHGLDITRAALTTGQPIAPYLQAFGVDLYLSANEDDVRQALACGVAAGLILPGEPAVKQRITQIRIAFDGDAVLFSDEAERIFEREGTEAFCRSEKAKARSPLEKGPFANLLAAISRMQNQYPADQAPIRTALVTARSAPAHERVIRTLQAWDVRIDEAFFLGGMDKSQVLQAFGAHIFFDDNEANTREAAKVVLAARVLRDVRDLDMRERDARDRDARDARDWDIRDGKSA